MVLHHSDGLIARKARHLGAIALLLLASTAAWCQSGPTTQLLTPPAGKVDVVTGQVRILAPGKPDRRASVGDVLNEGDFVLTGDASEALITMGDSGFIAVRANSRMQILSYKADGGDDDNGIFKLVAGGMRSVTGWIGKYNRKAYQIQTPTATIGIRGTDHETRYLPPGSADGPAGTYDKVFAGETSMVTDAGETAIDPDTAGFVAPDANQRPRVLASVPDFFKPGPNEDLINAKHAEIQKIIEQRRAERQRVVEQLRASMNEAAIELKQQSDSNKQGLEQRNAQADQQRSQADATRAALNSREQALLAERKTISALRMQIAQQVAPFLSTHRGVGKELRDLRDAGDQIRQDFVQLASERRALAQRVGELSEQRKATIDRHRQEAEQRLAALKAMLPDLEARRRAIEDMRAALDAGYASNPAGSDALSAQRQALDAAIDSANKQRHVYQDGMNALFLQNMAWSDENIASARKQSLETDQMIAGFNAREAELTKKQQANDQARETLQEGAVTDPEVKSQVHQLIEQTHAALADLQQQRLALREQYNSVHASEFRLAQEHQDEGAQALEIIREKHSEFAGRLANLEAESAAMQQEIRALYDQEQARYLEELKSARTAQQAAMPAESEPSQP
jgi:chorismate mutase